jgi:hypothetical protein
VDTVCIDKTNNAELSEAINSMFQWYMDSASCFVYLDDFNIELGLDSFGSSTWFTRGWTLQELLGPSDLTFCDASWTTFGTKSALADELQLITGIPTSVLRDRDLLWTFSVAQRMAWAADRKTTRPEDIAYCLLGLFAVNMPLLYGEGSVKAFERLQIEILEAYHDETLLAWQDDNIAPSARVRATIRYGVPGAEVFLKATLTGLFATSPQQFRRCTRIRVSTNWAPKSPLKRTNFGLELERQIVTMSNLSVQSVNREAGTDQPDDPTVMRIPLACDYSDNGQNCFMYVIPDRVCDLSPLLLQRFCRIIFPDSEVLDKLDVTEMNTTYERTEHRLFVCVSWPRNRVRLWHLCSR